ncbi:MAG TPA: hypothetical protein PKA27_10940 [Fimbriimonadaceae bacterium]|nr:hypothetical protein [Fimbriimonadaceae bacterium]
MGRLIGVWCLVLISCLASAQPRFSQQIIVNADGTVSDAVARDVNNDNIVVGKFGGTGDGTGKAFIWRNYSPYALAMPVLNTSNPVSQAYAIQNAANPTVVGNASNGSGALIPVRYTTADGVNYAVSSLLQAPFGAGGPTGSESCRATDINDSGTIVGFAFVTRTGVPGFNKVHAFRYVGGMIDLLASESANSRATAVNNGGRIC